MADNQSIQILRGSPTFDPETREDKILDGQPFYAKKTGQFFIGEDNKPIKDLAAINDPKSIKFTKDVYTAFNIGSIQASTSNRQKIFRKGETLADAFERIFDVTVQPTITQPSLALSISPTSVSGEVGSYWPTISNSTSTSVGYYPFNPDPYNTGVVWNNDESLSITGNTEGVFGNGSRTYTATRSYTVENEVIALDNKGNPSNPAQSISSGSKESTKTVSETLLYRQFYGKVDGTTIGQILANLKNVTSNQDDLKTYLQSSNPSEITVTLSSNGYIYFVTKNTINGATMGGFEFPIQKLGSSSFTNYYGAQYTVNVYRSSNEQTPNTYKIKLS